LFSILSTKIFCKFHEKYICAFIVNTIKLEEMGTAIIYSSSHGTTEKVANIIKEKLGSTTVQVFNLKDKSKVNLATYDTIIIGGSIHAGSMQQRVKKFIASNTSTLMQKKVALYQCCMNEKEEQTEFNNAFPEPLRTQSVYNAIVGGEYIFEKMNFIEKFLVRKISGGSSTLSKLRDEEINNLVNSLNK